MDCQTARENLLIITIEENTKESFRMDSSMDMELKFIPVALSTLGCLNKVK